jgi:predicted methyltransferase
MHTIRLVTVFLITVLASAGAGAGNDADAVAARITAQLQAPGRDKYDAAKDPGRKPVAVAQFFGIESGMTVLDMLTGAGYSAEILSAAVGPEGIVYAQNSHLLTRMIGGAHHEAMLRRIQDGRLPNVRYLVVDVDDMPFENDIDMAFWGTNMHDVYHRDGAAATLEFLAHVKRAMKPGAVLAFSEHRGNPGNDNAALHRLEQDIMTDMLEQAGFVIEATSELLANPDDDRTRSVFDDGLRYHTDRILIRARKP